MSDGVSVSRSQFYLPNIVLQENHKFVYLFNQKQVALVIVKKLQEIIFQMYRNRWMVYALFGSH